MWNKPLGMKINTHNVIAILWHIGLPIAAICQPTEQKITIVTDGSWYVSADEIQFGEFPMSYEQQQAYVKQIEANGPSAHMAKTYQGSMVAPGSLPIWKNWRSYDGGDQYAFLKKVAIPAGAVIKSCKATLNCDDAMRVYINGKLFPSKGLTQNNVSTPMKGDRWHHKLSAFMYNRAPKVYEDKEAYFFPGIENVILVEAINSPIYNNHGYISMSIELTVEIPAPQTPPVKKSPPPNIPKPLPPVIAKPIPAPAESPPTVMKSSIMKVGDVVKLENIRFKTNEAILDTKSKTSLDDLAALLRSNPMMQIEIGGHTNLLPKDDFCDRLSEERAKAVFEYLLTQNVAKTQVSYKGYGKRKPKIQGTSDEANRENQRVEITVLRV